MKDEASILYPSITICKKYSIEDVEIFSNLNNKSNDEDISELAISAMKNHLPTLDEQLFFFTQPGVMNLTFPCTTTLGGPTPGRPCAFPVTYFHWWSDNNNNDSFNGCLSTYDMGTSKPGCFTRVYENNTVDANKGNDDSWGYCPLDCKGEQPTPESPYNLGKPP